MSDWNPYMRPRRLLRSVPLPQRSYNIDLHLRILHSPSSRQYPSTKLNTASDRRKGESKPGTHPCGRPAGGRGSRGQVCLLCAHLVCAVKREDQHAVDEGSGEGAADIATHRALASRTYNQSTPVSCGISIRSRQYAHGTNARLVRAACHAPIPASASRHSHLEEQDAP